MQTLNPKPGLYTNMLEEHYFSEPQHYEVCWGAYLSQGN